VELELLTSVAEQRRSECGETDTDLLLEAGVGLQMPDSLPFLDSTHKRSTCGFQCA
tara:strand:- start:3425 stop:3592 length:168 start_codon:yes stop_codon:yes gene_type:complete